MAGKDVIKQAIVTEMENGIIRKQQFPMLTQHGIRDYSTLENYTWHVRRLKLIVGHLQLYNLNVLELQQCLQNLNDIAPRTKKDIYATLQTAMRQALVWGMLSSDPTVGLRTPL